MKMIYNGSNERVKNMKKMSNVLWGLILIGLGLVIGLNTLGITHINLFFRGWWTLFIIVPCFIGVITSSDKTSDLIGLLIGIALLLSCRNIIRFGTVIKLLLPTLLVVIGLSIIFKDTLNHKIKEEIKRLNKHDDTNKAYCATFGEQHVQFDKEEFTGCNLDAVFGGVVCDLTDCEIKEDALINACAVFGGIKILVPSHVDVKVSSTPIFGGVSNTSRKNKSNGKVTVYINATCIFGGVEIR